MLRKTGRNGKRLLLPYVQQGMKRSKHIYMHCIGGNTKHSGNTIYYYKILLYSRGRENKRRLIYIDGWMKLITIDCG